MPITNEADAIKAVVNVIKNKDTSELEDIFNYIFNTFMTKKGSSGTKGFMNICIMCTPSYLNLNDWMKAWNKNRQSKTFDWCQQHTHGWSSIGKEQVKVAGKLTPTETPTKNFPNWTPQAKTAILKNLIQTVGGGLKKGFPKRCLDELNGKSV